MWKRESFSISFKFVFLVKSSYLQQRLSMDIECCQEGHHIRRERCSTDDEFLSDRIRIEFHSCSTRTTRDNRTHSHIVVGTTVQWRKLHLAKQEQKCVATFWNYWNELWSMFQNISERSNFFNKLNQKNKQNY